jgi:hypothetical protein
VTTSPPDWQYPNPPSHDDPRVRIVLGVAAAALTAVVLAVLVGVVVTKRGVTFGGPDHGPVVLTAANTAGSRPFMPSGVAPPRIPLSEKAAQEIQSTLGQLPTADDRAARLASGAHPGLYGGSAAGAECDTAAVANYLSSHPDRAQAWAATVRIRPDKIAYYLNILTSAVLTTDTWVTGHDYSAGKAEPYQTVLQAGNAVLVDPAGVPRVQCISGNPLVPPANTKLTDLEITGQAWPGYSTQNVVAIAYSDAPASFTDPVPTRPLTELTLLDLATGEPLVRRVGNTLDLGQLPPGGPLPDPVAMNAPPARP